MGNDRLREQEALEWIEGFFKEITNLRKQLPSNFTIKEIYTLKEEGWK